MRAYPSDAGPQWRADLSRTSVLLSFTRGFSPNESMLRIAELARVTLATKGPGERGQTNRRLMPDEMRTMLREKFGNPMLGIYGAHLLLLEGSVDIGLLREVVRNLRGLLGLQHPDVEALALRAAGEPPPLPFEHPPMLCRSWLLIVDASVARPDLVTESLAERNTGRFLAEGPWHVERLSPTGTTHGKPDTLELSDVETALAEDLGVMKHIRRMSQTSTTPSDRANPEPKGLQRREVLADGLSAAPDLDDPGIHGDLHLRNLPVSENVEVKIDAAQLRSIVTRFGIPSTQLKRMLTTLEDKLTRSPGGPNLTIVLK